jgi:hypothetical protein
MPRTRLPRTRRVALVAALALLAGVALVGCGRSQPATAAYVGDTRYTERQVDAIADDISKLPSSDDDDPPRVQAVSLLVVNDLARRAAQAQSIAVPPSDYDGVARVTDLPDDSALVRVVGDWRAVASALSQRVSPVQPTEDDLREVFLGLRSNPNVPAGLTYEAVADQLRDDTQLPQMVAVRNVLREAAVKHGVVLNPRYRPLRVDLGDGERRVPFLIAEGSDVVTDLPTPSAEVR